MQTKISKIKIFGILLLLNSYSEAADTGHQNIFGLMPYIGYSSTVSQGTYNGNAAMINAEGSYLVDSSQANINNQQAYSLQLDNHLKKVDTFFEARQSNSFYRDLEDWQKRERIRLKKIGAFDREAIRSLYGR